MSTLFDVGDSSDSEDDVDYVPEACGYSSDEEDPLPHVSDEDDETGDNKKKKRKSRITKAANYVSETKESVSEDNKPVSSVDEKKKADDLFKSFLEEAAADMKETINEGASSGISCCGSVTSSPVVSASATSSPVVSASATSSPVVSTSGKSSCPSSTLTTPDKIFEFAGETVTVSNDTVKSSSIESLTSSEKKVDKELPASASPSVPTKKRGLDSVLGLIQNKKQKLSVLQKTQLDWKSFKKDEGLDEDLEKFNRGKGGYIERQRFLQRSDVRSYEIERDMRMSKRRDK